MTQVSASPLFVAFRSAKGRAFTERKTTLVTAQHPNPIPGTISHLCAGKCLAIIDMPVADFHPSIVSEWFHA